MKEITPHILNILQGNPSFVRESPKVAYGEDFVPFPDEKDLLRAHLMIELIERYHYVPESLVVRAYVQVKHNGVDYAEVDLIVHDKEHQPFILIAVETPQEYEQKFEETMRKLFAVAVLMRQTHPPRYLMCYTRWYEGERRTIRQVVVDYSKYQTFSAWHESSRPTISDIPSHG